MSIETNERQVVQKVAPPDGGRGSPLDGGTPADPGDADRGRDIVDEENDDESQKRGHVPDAVPTARVATGGTRARRRHDTGRDGTQLRTTRLTSGARRSLIRQVAATGRAIADTAAERRRTLASLLGVGDDIAELTVAVMTDDGSAFRRVRDLTAARAAIAKDPLAGALAVAELGRKRIAAAWSLLETCGVDLPKRMPASDAKAALTLTRAIQDLDADVLTDLEAAANLWRR